MAFSFKDSPCNGCKERKLYCHSTCEKYREYEEKAEETRRNRINYHEINVALFDIKRRKEK